MRASDGLLLLWWCSGWTVVATLTAEYVLRTIGKDECQVPENEFLARPVFSDGDNLSYEGCGLVEGGRGGATPPWRVVLGRDDCDGLLLSRRAILVHQEPFSLCSLEARAKGAVSRPLEARMGKCVTERGGECEGYVRRVGAVRRLEAYPADQLYLLLLEKPLPKGFEVPSVRPLCLFNRDNLADSKLQFLAGLLAGSGKEVGVVGVRECMPERMLQDKCRRYLFALCVAVDEGFLEDRRALVWVSSEGRHFLRAVAFANSRDVVHSRVAFHDVLRLVDPLVRLAPDIHRQPEAPPVHNQVQFVFSGEKEHLSFANCGLESGAIRSRRDVDEVATVAHVFGGRNAERGRHPWHAHLALGHGDGHVLNCGGSLVSDRHVVTAAHCVFVEGVLASARDLHVTLGMWNASDPEEAWRQAQAAWRVFVSGGFNASAGNFAHDVTVVVMATPFRFTAHVQPVCLWNDVADLDRVANKTATVVGWGLSGDGGERPAVLQRAELVVRSHLDCFLQNRPFFSGNLQPGINFCAGHANGTSVCNGDSGGGLLLRRGARWFLRGVVSFGKARPLLTGDEYHLECDPRFYSLFADIATYIPWIATLINST
ncbi:uncharacterized protein LOC132195803 [Neocloeon triangulifer]|uniref:uncharacterized protein LOC132195803 n=1 Tax=Neocloeon triangulifer TaxID=2078957 RepID=UPI00286EEB69|nr:uncharacterized protein LOC132195803 [Neocloeon triangulifer]